MHIIASGFAGDDIGIYVLFGIVFAILVVFIWMPIQSHREAKKALEKMDTPSEEPELFEQSAVVLKKHCYAEASRRDSPLHDKHFFVTFQTTGIFSLLYSIRRPFTTDLPLFPRMPGSVIV